MTSRLLLGREVRADLFGSPPVGIFLDHETPGGRPCSKPVLFSVYRVLEREPLTLAGTIECGCGLRGRVVRGEWRPG